MKEFITPALFAIFPILALYAHNIDKVYPSLLVRPAVVVLVTTVVLFLLFRVILKNWRKAALVSSTFLILFFFYGHAASKPLVIVGNITESQTVVAALFGVLFGVSTLLIVTSKSDLRVPVYIFRVIGIVLVVSSLGSIGLYELSAPEVIQETLSSLESPNTDEDTSQVLPDIYYIILDGHARGDIVEEIYEYDNSWFVNGLAERGFYVAEKSTSNYPQTYQSLASSLNFEYINYLGDAVGIKSEDRRPFQKLINNSRVYNFLKEKGYVFVTFASGWTGVDGLSIADIHMQGRLSIDEFENVLIETTPLTLVLGKDIQHTLHRNKVLYAFDHLADVTTINLPTFTYAHIMSPHPPFVFDSEGQAIEQHIAFSLADSTWKLVGDRTSGDYIRLYRQQLAYVDKQIIAVIDEVLSRSDVLPIIILQSDHGPAAYFRWEDPADEAMRERMSILNAYYLPNEKYELLYESITPVNTFRVIFNEYFGQDYELLEDRNYFASWWTPYQFLDVTDMVQNTSAL